MGLEPLTSCLHVASSMLQKITLLGNRCLNNFSTFAIFSGKQPVSDCLKNAAKNVPAYLISSSNCPLACTPFPPSHKLQCTQPNVPLTHAQRTPTNNPPSVPQTKHTPTPTYLHLPTYNSPNVPPPQLPPHT